MKETIKLVAVLTIICVIAGSLLALVYAKTKGPIAAAKAEELLAGLRVVLPAYDNEPNKEIHTLSDGDIEWTFYLARKENVFSGAAFEAVSKDGYGGDIKILVGVDADGKLLAIEILSQTETPGLGAKIEGDFKDQFAGHEDAAAPDVKWCAVQKDGGNIVAITGATISSRAVSKAVAVGLEVYRNNLSAIQNAKPEMAE